MGEIGNHIADEDIRKGDILRLEREPRVRNEDWGRRATPDMRRVHVRGEMRMVVELGVREVVKYRTSFIAILAAYGFGVLVAWVTLSL